MSATDCAVPLLLFALEVEGIESSAQEAGITTAVFKTAPASSGVSKPYARRVVGTIAVSVPMGAGYPAMDSARSKSAHPFQKRCSVGQRTPWVFSPAFLLVKCCIRAAVGCK
jgi:hypothetical protein